MNHFDIVRQIQEDTGGFTAFIPWSFQRENTSLGPLREGRSHCGRIPENAGDLAHLSRQYPEHSSRPG